MKTDHTKKRILKAAKECFDQYGEKRVSVEDISLRAGVHRQTVYRLYKNREDLRREVVLNCIEELGIATREAVERCDTLKKAIEVGAITSVELARRDSTLEELLRTDWEMGQERVASRTKASEHFEMAWKEAFQRAKKSGEISPRWKFTDFSQWLRGVIYILWLRNDLSRNGQKRLIQQFMRPAFL